jgi:hypothetical protein
MAVGGASVGASRFCVVSLCFGLIVKKKPFQFDAFANSLTALAVQGGCASDEEADSAAALDDLQLAQRCVAGEVAAWEQIYAQCHDPLSASVKVMLGAQSRDANLVDEIVARVWYTLVANDGEVLAQYKPKRGSLVTYMRTLARDQITRYFREELRRRKREQSSVRAQPLANSSPVDSLAEFLGTLTPHEQVFCSENLLAESTGTVPEAQSTTNIWQTSHRIYRKLLRFLDRLP